MPSQRNILSVFLASPGDLVSERRAAREVVAEINQSVREINWEIELLGWEDTTPGAGRPQELINADVDSCHLFLGLLWKRWGTPTGDYSSGFEEEFHRAIGRRQNSYEPEIMLVFKEVDAEALADPGPQLAKVLEFKDERIEKRDVFFEHVKGEGDLRQKLRVWLHRHVLRLDRLQNVSPESNQPRSQSTKATDDNEGPQPTEALVQLEHAATDVVGSIRASEDPSLINATRLQVFATTITSGESTSELLEPHFANLVYLHRAEFSFLSSELGLLLRSHLQHIKDENVAGMYWIRNVPDTVLRDYFLSLLEISGSAAVKAAVLNYMAILAEAGLELELSTVIPCIDDSDLREDALRTIGRAGTTEHLEQIDIYIGEETTSSISAARLRAKALILLRTNIEAAMQFLLENPEVSENDEVATQMSAHLATLESHTLEALLVHSNGKVRASAAEQLLARDQISKGTLLTLTTDRDVQVRGLAIRALLQSAVNSELEDLLKRAPEREYWWPGFTNGVGYPEANHIRADIYGSMGEEYLKEKLDFYDTHFEIMLRSLGHYFPKSARTLVRELLADEGTSFMEKSYQRWVETFGETHASGLRTSDGHMRSELISSCLAVLSVVGQKQDLKWVRKYLASESRDVQTEAILTLEKLGNASDAERLVPIIESGEWEIPIIAARAFFNLSANKEDAVEFLLSLDKETVLIATISSLNSAAIRNIFSRLVELLRNKSAAVRKAALGAISAISSTEELKELLVNYLAAEPTYFYNVVFWLDTLAYAPEAISKAKKNELTIPPAVQRPNLDNPFH